MKNSWFEAGFLNDVDESLHNRISSTLDLTTLCLIENKELFDPILMSSVNLMKRTFVKFPRLQNDIPTIANIMYDYLEFYFRYKGLEVDDSVIINEFIKEYGKKFLN